MKNSYKLKKIYKYFFNSGIVNYYKHGNDINCKINKEYLFVIHFTYESYKNYFKLKKHIYFEYKKENNTQINFITTRNNKYKNSISNDCDNEVV